MGDGDGAAQCRRAAANKVQLNASGQRRHACSSSSRQQGVVQRLRALQSRLLRRRAVSKGPGAPDCDPFNTCSGREAGLRAFARPCTPHSPCR